MAELSDAFIALPGGLGTLEETFETLTWLQLQIHRKPIGLLNVDGFYDSLEIFLDELVSRGFVGQTHRALLQSARSPDALIEKLESLIQASAQTDPSQSKLT
jgi:uncharacterized protein (TIGR00730 family)